MDSRAKQRLTGAVILVALFVLLVPELLRGPRNADAPEGAAADEGMRRYTIDLDASAPPAQPDISSTQPAVSLPPVSDDRAKPGDEAAPAAPASAPVEPPTVAAVPRDEAPKPQAPTPPAPVRAAPTQAAPAQSAPTPAAPVTAPSGSFVVQLGSFRDRDNANRLVRDMTAKGFAAFVAPITSGGRELYRVRVGPVRDRPAAEALAAQLRRLGQSGAIVPIS
jgi:DedD protein